MRLRKNRVHLKSNCNIDGTPDMRLLINRKNLKSNLIKEILLIWILFCFKIFYFNLNKIEINDNDLVLFL